MCAAKGHGLPWRGFNVCTEVCGGLVDEADPPHGLAHHDRLDSEHYRLCEEAVGAGNRVASKDTERAPPVSPSFNTCDVNPVAAAAASDRRRDDCLMAEIH